LRRWWRGGHNAPWQIHIKKYNTRAVASAPNPLNPRTIAIALIIVAAVAWAFLSNTYAPPRPATAAPVTVVPATAAPQQPPATSGQLAPTQLLACPTDAYKTRSGLIVCGVVAVDQQYVWVQQGWISAVGNYTAGFTLYGDVSSCTFQMTANRLVVNCKAPIAVGR